MNALLFSAFENKHNSKTQHKLCLGLFGHQGISLQIPPLVSKFHEKEGGYLLLSHIIFPGFSPGKQKDKKLKTKRRLRRAFSKRSKTLKPSGACGELLEG